MTTTDATVSGVAAYLLNRDVLNGSFQAGEDRLVRAVKEALIKCEHDVLHNYPAAATHYKDVNGFAQQIAAHFKI